MMTVIAGGEIVSPSSMTKNATSPTWATDTTWVPITGWTAGVGSTVTSDQLVVIGSGTATVACSVPFTGGSFAPTHTIRLVDQLGNVLATSPGVTGNSGTCTVPATTLDLTGVARIGVQMNASGAGGGNVAASTPTLTIS